MVAATDTAVDAGGGEASANPLGAHPIQSSVSTDTDSTHSHRSSLSSDDSETSQDAANRMNRETNRENFPSTSPSARHSQSSRRPRTIAEDTNTGANIAGVNAADARASTTEGARDVDALGRTRGSLSY